MAGLGKEGQVLGIRGTTLAGVPFGCRHPVVQLSPCLVTFSSRQLAHRLPLARWRHAVMAAATVRVASVGVVMPPLVA